jgi:hypothetical protein
VTLCCKQDDRRDQVRRMNGLNGLDYVEVLEDQVTLHAYFLGKLPPELRENKPGIEQYLRLDGGERVKNIQVTDVDPFVDPNPERDDFVVIKLNRYGDFSTYTLRLIGVANIDPHYDRVAFSFKINCPSDLDCVPACTCVSPEFDEPEINYLAKDYQSFRQLIFDRFSVLVPDWKERHAADIGVMLIELLAYTGDYLSYYQDAVATEAYLDTARQRISVRRHARLVDYLLNEGCNARAWVFVAVEADVELVASDVSFTTGISDPVMADKIVLTWNDLRQVPVESFEVFEPLVADRSTPIRLLKAHNEILFYTFGETSCCLEKGSTTATLLDRWIGDNAERALKLQPGDVLIFEEVFGPVTGLEADADPLHRHAVRLTSVTYGEDPLLQTEHRPIPYVEINWAPEDALPFTFCISAIGAAPDCDFLENVSVARGNVILSDHGKTQDPENFGPVPAEKTEASCECVDEPGDTRTLPGSISPVLKASPITFSKPVRTENQEFSSELSATSLTTQDFRRASPGVRVMSEPSFEWQSRYDLIESGPDDKHFVVEIDNFGKARLRFGKNGLGYQPATGTTFHISYRVGNGIAGNVGTESISHIVFKETNVAGITEVRNLLPAKGGTEPEPIAEAKLFAPYYFRKRLDRAVIAQDYQQIASLNPAVQRSSAVLEWSGSWYEANVAIDPLGRATADESLLKKIEQYLERFRRMGHDLVVEQARYVPILLRLEVCVWPHYQAGHVKAALLNAFSNRILAGGKRGFFHPDNLTFGDGIYLSHVIAAAKAVTGVECVRVTKFQRLFESPNHEIANGVLALQSTEIAQLDNDPNYPERGRLEVHVSGGR